MSNKWINLDGYHTNTDLLTTFFWRDGGLVLYHVNGKNVRLRDLDQKLYVKLCMALGTPHWKEEDDDAQQTAAPGGEA